MSKLIEEINCGIKYIQMAYYYVRNKFWVFGIFMHFNGSYLDYKENHKSN